jgi:hypothetical protein
MESALIFDSSSSLFSGTSTSAHGFTYVNGDPGLLTLNWKLANAGSGPITIFLAEDNAGLSNASSLLIHKVSVTPTPVPEPSSGTLLILSSLVGMISQRRRK